MIRRTALIAVFVFATLAIGRADCLPFDQAPKHIGEIVCLRGRVVKIAATTGGTHYLNFCENFLVCPFTVVVFPGHLESIGDVRSLQGRDLEIDGLVKLYKGHAEIVLTEASQLHGDAASHIPPLPQNYDVSEHGKFSAGSPYAKKPKKSKRPKVDNTDPMSDGAE